MTSRSLFDDICASIRIIESSFTTVVDVSNVAVAYSVAVSILLIITTVDDDFVPAAFVMTTPIE